MVGIRCERKIPSTKIIGINKKIKLKSRGTDDLFHGFVRMMKKDDIPQVFKLTKKQWEGHEKVNKDMFERRIENFREGGVVLEMLEGQFKGRIVGCINSFLIEFNVVEDLPSNFDILTDGGTLNTHNPDGNTLVCPQISADPEAGLKGIPRALISMEADIAKILLEGRYPDYHILAYSRFSHYGSTIEKLKAKGGIDMQMDGQRYVEVNRGLLASGKRLIDTNCAMHYTFARDIAGAKPDSNPIAIFENGCPGDIAAGGYNVVFQYR